MKKVINYLEEHNIDYEKVGKKVYLRKTTAYGDEVELRISRLPEMSNDKYYIRFMGFIETCDYNRVIENIEEFWSL